MMRAHEPPLLAEHGQGEVRVLSRAGYRSWLWVPGQEALAPELARADGDLGLDDVVARAQRVARRGPEQGEVMRPLLVVASA